MRQIVNPGRLVAKPVLAAAADHHPTATLIPRLIPKRSSIQPAASVLAAYAIEKTESRTPNPAMLRWNSSMIKGARVFNNVRSK
jgi:hypothetical protein